MSKVLYEKYIVDNDDTLLNYLRSKMENKSKNNIKSLLTKEKVTINGKLETRHDYPVYKNDVIEIKNNFITSKKYTDKIPIIYEDENIIVIDKPAGLLTMATKKEKKHTAYRMISDYLTSQDKNNKVFIIHRLDKDTSGVVIFAKSMEVKNKYQNAWSKNVLKREYIAVVEGVIKDEKKTIKSYLKENKEGIVYSSLKPNDGKIAITCYEKIKNNLRYTMLRINLKTGRKNQIRVHMKDIRHPIIGDKKYGVSGLDPVKRLCLHASKLELIDPLTNKKVEYIAETPFLLEALL